MSIIGNNILAGASGNQGYEIERSLRFNDDDTAYLSRTPSSAGNRKTWTWSGWVKRGNLGTLQTLFSGGAASPAYDALRFTAADKLQFYQQGATATNLVTTAVFRDVSAWYHVVLKLNSTASEAAIFVNGVEQTVTGTQPTNTDRNINNTISHGVGATAVNSAFSSTMDGYIAEVNFIDGTALNASNFAETDTVTGAWIPKKYSGTYGTNGFYLNFSDNSGVTATTLGKDSSGNGNNWTPNNFSVTAGAGNDSLEDTPTNNWCTLNPLNPTSATLSNGNLDFFRVGKGGATSTFGVDSGKFYYEVTGDANVGSGGFAAGFVQQGYDTDSGTDIGQSTTSFGCRFAVSSTIFKPLNGSTTTISGQTNDTTTVFAFAVNFDNGAVEVFRNGSSIHTQTLTLPAGKFFPAVASETSSANKNIQINFGQRAFDYTPPAGFKALNTANLPVPTIKDGTEYFNTVLWSGDGNTPRSITGVGFQPDLIWTKPRSTADDHLLMDVIRGTGNLKWIATNSSSGEGIAFNNGNVTSLDSDGFTIGTTGGTNQLNATSRAPVAWNWKAGGSGSANTDGSISSTVSVNADAGFSIVSYTGSGANATIGHGLGVAPSMMIVKNRDRSASWAIYHGILGATKVLQFDTNSVFTDSTSWNNTSPTSSVFTIGTANSVNASTEDIIAYCFAEVEGYSKFGSYTGNGSADGPFVACGFRPSWVLLKSSSNTTNWYIFDTARNEFNLADKSLFPNLSNAENTGGNEELDIVSNGFKMRNASSSFNISGYTYIFMAFAETPFKYANAR